MALYNASYTESELQELNLPGYRTESTLRDIVATGDTDWQPVLSLSIFSANPETAELEVLTAIRRDESLTHPHVISTPTGRFPKAFQQPLVGAKCKELAVAPRVKLSKVTAQSRVGIARFNPNLEELPNRGAPLSFVAHELLARKLGLAHGLQRTSAGPPVGTVSLMEMSIGFSYVGDIQDENGIERPLWEPLIMYVAAMRLADRKLIPSESVAYRSLSWVSTERFMAGHDRKDPRLLIPEIKERDEATVCIRGLCLISTSLVIVSNGLNKHLGLEP